MRTVLTRFRAQLFALCLAFNLVALPGCGTQEQEIARPPERVVLIVADTLRRDHVSVYRESPLATVATPATPTTPTTFTTSTAPTTPNIDALARRGQVFSDARSSYHQTTMSMASIFTGRTPSIERGYDRERLDWSGETWCGLARFADAPDPATGDDAASKNRSQRKRCIRASTPTLAEAFHAAGYWTAGVVTNKLLYRPGGYERGFEHWVEVPGRAPFAGQANRAVHYALRARSSDRFFLYVHFMDVHDYYLRGDAYASGVATVDSAVGRLVSMLEELDLMRDTVVIFTSDHGEHFEDESHLMAARRGHSGSPSFESLLRVPLIIAPPLFEGVQHPVRGDDLHRMIRSLAGLEPGPEPDLEPGELFLSERGFQTYRRGRWKSFRHRESGRHLLVDLQRDPGETRNVAHVHSDVLSRHASRMDDLARTLGAPTATASRLSEEDRSRLRALGYAEDE